MNDMQDFELFINVAFWGILALYLLKRSLSCIKVVSTQTAQIVERLGRFSRKLEPGIHFLIPWVDRVSFVHDLRELTVDVPPQQCFTADNVRVAVDGVMYIQVTDPVKASYGVTNYGRAATQLALTTSRAIIATLDLDKTFEERDLISAKVVEEVSKAGQSWGIQVLRYEIKNIEPPDTVKDAMELQVTAERRRRAIIAKAEGERQSRVDRSEGIKAELIARSEGEMQRRINEAEGRASEILSLAQATASSIERVAQAVSVDGGEEAVRLRLREKYLDRLGALGQSSTQLVLGADLTRLEEILQGIELDVEVERSRTGVGVPVF